MVLTYIDSSALLRLCLREGDISLIDTAMASTPVTSILTMLEVPNAICARFHRGGIDQHARDGLLSLSEQLLARVNLLDLGIDTMEEGARIGSSHLVRALDAIHLATAIHAAHQQSRWGNTLRFCTADTRQATTAKALLGVSQVDVLPPL